MSAGGGIRQAVKNITALVDFECEHGGPDRIVVVSLHDLVEVVSWFRDVGDNDHVDVASFMKED